MLAIRPDHAGGPEVLTLEEHPTPTLAAGQALVRVSAAGVNFIDIYQRSGIYPVPPPMPLGLEGAGVVEAVAADVTLVKPGDRVAWSRGSGSYATHAAIAEAALVPVPDGIDATIAAAAMLQGMTAHYLAHTTFALKPGDVCVVHAAAGGVGLLLCQMAKRAGATVIGTVSTDAKAALARAAGADVVAVHGRDDFAAEARRVTGGRGVDVVYDSIGKDTFDASLASLRLRGMLVLFGQSSGAPPPVDLQILAAKGSLFATRPRLHDYIATREELIDRSGAVLGAVARGELRISIGATLPLADAREAHRRLAARETTGKILLLP